MQRSLFWLVAPEEESITMGTCDTGWPEQETERSQLQTQAECRRVIERWGEAINSQYLYPVMSFLHKVPPPNGSTSFPNQYHQLETKSECTSLWGTYLTILVHDTVMAEGLCHQTVAEPQAFHSTFYYIYMVLLT